MSPEPTAAESVAAHLASREAQWAPVFADTPTDVDGSPAETLAFVDAAVSSFDWTPDADQSAVIAAYRAAFTEDGFVHLEVSEPMADVVSAIETDTEDRRDAAKFENVLGVSVVASIRIELSTGGPGDYITAEVDPETRSTSNLRYHFVPWFDHADVPIGSDSPLVQLVDYYAETVSLPDSE